MEQRLSVLGLEVSDVERSMSFYRALGWTVSSPDPAVAFAQLNGVVLSLYRDQARDTGLPPKTDDIPSARIAPAHNVRERAQLDPLIARMVAAGARVITPAHDTDWGGRSAYVADPDGHLWELAWNPFWAIDADGNVTLSAP